MRSHSSSMGDSNPTEAKEIPGYGLDGAARRLRKKPWSQGKGGGDRTKIKNPPENTSGIGGDTFCK